MKSLILLISCFLAMESVTAQNRKLDSLDHLISQSTSDTDKIKLAITKINILSNINLDSSINLGMQTLQFAQQIHFYRGELDIRQALASNYCFKGAYESAEEHFTFLEKFIKSTDSFDFADLYTNKGMMYGMQSKYDSSIILYLKAIGIFERANKEKKLGSAYSNIAIAYQQQSNYPQALYYLQKSLELSEKNKNEIDQAYTLVNMGNTFTNIGDTARAEKSYLKAIELSKIHALTNVELYSYTNLASMYISQHRWQMAYEYAIKAAALGESMGDQGIQAASLSKAAQALAFNNKIDEAESLAKRAIAIADSSTQPLNIHQAYAGMGNILRLKGSYQAAIPYFEKSFLALKGSDLYSIDNGEVYKELSECYEKTNNHKKALENYKIAAQIIDSVRSRENVQKSIELTMNYEFDKKQQLQQAQQNAKDEIAGAKQLGLIIGLVLAFLLAVVAFVGFKNKQKANALLKSQKEEIENTLALLKATQSQLIQSEKMASLGELTAGIAHEIQNPLNFVNNFSDVNRELIFEMKEEIEKGNVAEVKSIADTISENEEKINHHGKRADGIVKGMLQHSRSNSGVKELTDINSLASEYLRLAYHGFRSKDKFINVTMQTDLDEQIGNISIVPQEIGRVVLNLITNAFYAVNEKHKQLPEGYSPTVSVSTKKHKNKVEIIIKDNGNGVSQKLLDKIFQPFFTTKPTGQGTGLGLSISYDIIKAHGGELKVETKEGEYAVFVITLPV